MLIFDIETQVNKSALEFMPDPKPPSNYKKQESIDRYIEEEKAKQIDRAALDADYGKIVAIGVKEDDVSTDSRVVGGEEAMDEFLLILWFWSIYLQNGGQSCGYNIIGFDLPYILRRSFALGIKPSIIPNLAKYRTHPTLDLMMVLYNWGRAKSLKWVCQRYDIENPLPDLDGSQVKDMDAETLKLYVENDVNLTYHLYQKMLGVYF